MNPVNLLQAFRNEVRDTEEDYLWSDAEVYQYMNWAQVEFCRRIGGIADSVSPQFRIELTDGMPYYTLPETILKVRAAIMESDGRELLLMNEENVYAAGRTLAEPAGKIDTLIIGLEQDYIRTLTLPSEADVGDHIRLIVYRLPLTEISSAGEGALEIQSHHHPHLLLGMCAFAHRKQDAETFNKSRADDYAQQFEVYCSRSRAERERREHRPRVVTYYDV